MKKRSNYIAVLVPSLEVNICIYIFQKNEETNWWNSYKMNILGNIRTFWKVYYKYIYWNEKKN